MHAFLAARQPKKTAQSPVCEGEVALSLASIWQHYKVGRHDMHGRALAMRSDASTAWTDVFVTMRQSTL
jgi:hypothetical protein